MARRLSFWHPLTIYLVFHIYSFSYRAFVIYGGAPLLYFGQAGADMITIQEINRAMLWADVALILFALGGLLAHLRFESRIGRPVLRMQLNDKIVKCIALPCLFVGLAFMYAAKTGVAVQDDGEASAMAGYAQVFAMWPLGALGLLVFVLGFRWYLLLLISILLGVVALQGYHRFMLILPLMYFTAYFLMTRRRRWPNFPILIGALLIALIFPRLKYIGKAVQGGDTADAVALVSQSFDFSSKTSDAMVGVGEGFLDQYAGALTLIDENERKLWGSPYLAIITLPVPRAWWPGKPGLADHLKEISTRGRDYAREGRIITYLGESYLNFGYAGLILVPTIAGYLLVLLCLHSTTGPILRLSCYVYLVLYMALIQTFRDGLASLIVFSIVHNMPMLFTWVLHVLPGGSNKVLDRPLADSLRGDEKEVLMLGQARGHVGQRGRRPW